MRRDAVRSRRGDCYRNGAATRESRLHVLGELLPWRRCAETGAGGTAQRNHFIYRPACADLAIEGAPEVIEVIVTRRHT